MRRAATMILVLVAGALLARQLWPRRTPQLASPRTPPVQVISARPEAPSWPSPVKFVPYREDPFAPEQSDAVEGPTAFPPLPGLPLPQWSLLPPTTGTPSAAAESQPPDQRPAAHPAEKTGENASSADRPVLIGTASGPNGRIAVIEVRGEIHRVKTGQILLSRKVMIEGSGKVALMDPKGLVEIVIGGGRD